MRDDKPSTTRDGSPNDMEYTTARIVARVLDFKHFAVVSVIVLLISYLISREFLTAYYSELGVDLTK